VILDTNALSAYADNEALVVELMDAAPSIEVPVIALGEFAFGIQDSRRAKAYAEWLAKFVTLIRVLSVTAETAQCYADARSKLKQNGTPIPANDLWIAALALQHQMPLLSRDKHFDAVKGVRRISW